MVLLVYQAIKCIPSLALCKLSQPLVTSACVMQLAYMCHMTIPTLEHVSCDLPQLMLVSCDLHPDTASITCLQV